MIVISIISWITLFYYIITKLNNDNSTTDYEETTEPNINKSKIKESIPITIQIVRPIIVGGNRTKGSRNEGIMDAW